MATSPRNVLRGRSGEQRHTLQQTQHFNRLHPACGVWCAFGGQAEKFVRWQVEQARCDRRAVGVETRFTAQHFFDADNVAAVQFGNDAPAPSGDDFPGFNNPDARNRSARPQHYRARSAGLFDDAGRQRLEFFVVTVQENIHLPQ
jgi:hypothetical protein